MIIFRTILAECRYFTLERHSLEPVMFKLGNGPIYSAIGTTCIRYTDRLHGLGESLASAGYGSWPVGSKTTAAPSIGGDAVYTQRLACRCSRDGLRVPFYCLAAGCHDGTFPDTRNVRVQRLWSYISPRPPSFRLITLSPRTGRPLSDHCPLSCNYGVDNQHIQPVDGR